MDSSCSGYDNDKRGTDLWPDDSMTISRRFYTLTCLSSDSDKINEIVVLPSTCFFKSLLLCGYTKKRG